MRRISCVVLIVALGLSCQRPSQSNEPGAPDPATAFRLQYELLIAGDTDGLWALFSDAVKRECLVLRYLARKNQLPEILGARPPGRICGAPDSATRKRLVTPAMHGVEYVKPDLALVYYGAERHAQWFVRDGKTWRIDEYVRSVVWTFTEPAGDSQRQPRKVVLPTGD